MAEELRKWVYSAVVGRIYVVNKIVGELVKSQGGRLFDVHLCFLGGTCVVQARQNELLALVQLYEELGGGAAVKRAAFRC
jgi:hypothetical protein